MDPTIEEYIESIMTLPDFKGLDRDRLRESLRKTFTTGSPTDYEDEIIKFLSGTPSTKEGGLTDVLPATEVVAESTNESDDVIIDQTSLVSAQHKVKASDSQEQSPHDASEKAKSSTDVGVASVAEPYVAPDDIDPLLLERFDRIATTHNDTSVVAADTVLADPVDLEVSGDHLSLGKFAIGTLGGLFILAVIALATGSLQAIARAGLKTKAGQMSVLRELLRYLATTPSLTHRRSRNFMLPTNIRGESYWDGDKLFDLVMEHYSDFYGPAGDKLDFDDFDVQDTCAEFKLNDVSLFVRRVEDTPSGLTLVCDKVDPSNMITIERGFRISYVNPALLQPWSDSSTTTL